jgi:hypothetical protein
VPDTAIQYCAGPISMSIADSRDRCSIHHGCPRFAKLTGFLLTEEILSSGLGNPDASDSPRGHHHC